MYQVASTVFGAVFGVTSVAGPLLGGFFVETLSWRWIFYINLPIGVIALLVTALALSATGQPGQHTIDYLGTVLLTVAASSLILLTSLGGTIAPWGSAPIILLAVAGGVFTLGFVLAEQRAAEPVVPLHLFRNAVFSLSSAIGFVVVFALFGATAYLPLFLQVAGGAFPTSSGLRLLPMILGLLLTSITSGQLISRWGRYKAFPIAGTAVMTLGMFLLSRMNEHTSVLVESLSMLVFGLGLGLVTVPIIAVAFLLSWLLPEVRLRATTQATDVGHTFAMPTTRTSQEEIERALHVLASRDSLDQIYRRLAAHAGVDLDPRSSWLLFRLLLQAPISQESLADAFH